MTENERDDDDASELDANFFEDAILVRLGEGLLEVVQRARGQPCVDVVQSVAPAKA